MMEVSKALDGSLHKMVTGAASAVRAATRQGRVIARAIYHTVIDSNQPSVAVNCAALPETGASEIEIFGH